ncbi:DMT family transporter [Hyphomicrobium sp.]|uniref:DMT family transporter n=1 Tax=Hyphomicrobium sp. TaxID=82 RepID=UPI003F711558
MSLQALGLAALAFLAGAMISVQAPLNAIAASRLGHPLGAATLSFVVGALCLLAVTLVVARGQVAWGEAASLPPLLYLGGVLGAIFVTITIVLTPTLGIGAVIALAIAGQVVAGLALDHFGMFGLAVREVTLGRGIGAALAFVGALMVRYL